MEPQLPPSPPSLPSAAPPRLARALAILAIVVAGLFGGMIGYSVVDLQCRGDSSTQTALGGLVGAPVAAAGVALLAVLTLRAAGAWQPIHAHGGPAPLAPRRS